MSDPVAAGSYEIIGVLGHGGMGKVYKAQHPYIGKQVAVKFLKSELSAKPDSVQRFFQEARAVNDIHHENVIDVLDFGKTPEGEYFIIMELLQGKTLGDAIKNEAPFTQKRIGHVGLQICSALAAAHEKGIIHRDLKPDNIFLIPRAGQKDFIKVLDFGLAKLVDDNSGTHTTTGMVMGTPLYMAPEQALGRPLDAQTDVYALGVILFQMATGTVPFFDPNPVALATMHVTAPVPKPSERVSSVDPNLEKVILKCLEKEKHKRYLSMRDVAVALSEVCRMETTPYFGVELTKGTEGSEPSAEGDEMPTSIDGEGGERTQVTASPLKANPSEENVVVSISKSNPSFEPSVNETSNLRAEITGNNAGKSSNKGLVIGVAFILLLAAGVGIVFSLDGSKTKQQPTAQPAPTTVQTSAPASIKTEEPKLNPESSSSPVTPATQETKDSKKDPKKDPKDTKKDPKNKDTKGAETKTNETKDETKNQPTDPTLNPPKNPKDNTPKVVGDGTVGFDTPKKNK